MYRFENQEHKGQPGGYPDLDDDGKVPIAQLPTSSLPVTSVNGQTGDVVLAAADVGADVDGAAATAVTTAEAYADGVAAAAEAAAETYTDEAIERIRQSGVVAANAAHIPFVGLEAWYDASDRTSLSVNETGHVTKWQDRSGNGMDLYLFSGEGPLVAPGELNGRDVIDFTPFPSTLYAEDPADVAWLHEEASTVFAVVRTLSDTNGYVIDTQNNSPGYQLLAGNSVYGDNVTLVGVGDGVLTLKSSSPNKPNGAFFTITAISDPAAATASRAFIRINGSYVGSTNGETGAISTNPPGTALALGGDNFKYAEVLVYRGVLSAAAIAQVEAYLHRKSFSDATPYRIPGVPYVSSYPVNFDDPDLDTDGKVLFTPAVGDELLDAWVEIDEAWDQTCYGDIGTFTDTHGWYYAVLGGAVVAGAAMDSADDDTFGGAAGLLVSPFPQNRALASSAAALDPAGRVAPGKFTTADPIKFVVSTDGSSGGGAPGAGSGRATVYVVTCTPVGVA